MLATGASDSGATNPGTGAAGSNPTVPETSTVCMRKGTHIATATTANTQKARKAPASNHKVRKTINTAKAAGATRPTDGLVKPIASEARNKPSTRSPRPPSRNTLSEHSKTRGRHHNCILANCPFAMTPRANGPMQYTRAAPALAVQPEPVSR
ncbi:MAG: hypothetical protein CL930_03150 [Deltaproteobacteria bacterium]|nr:hypothetical protein [Deltaproteobacteria bacterium]